MSSSERFESLLREHRGIIFRVARGYCHDPSEQADLAQEIVLQVWGSRDHYDGRVKASTWIYRIALNVAISSFRRQQTRRKHVVPAPAGLVDMTASAPVQADLEPALLKLKAFVEELDPLNRAVMTLYLDRLSHREIAEVLGISESNVGTKVNRLRKRLQAHLEALSTTTTKERNGH